MSTYNPKVLKDKTIQFSVVLTENFVNLANIFMKYRIKSSRYILILRAEPSNWHIKTWSAISVVCKALNYLCMNCMYKTYHRMKPECLFQQSCCSWVCEVRLRLSASRWIHSSRNRGQNQHLGYQDDYWKVHSHGFFFFVIFFQVLWSLNVRFFFSMHFWFLNMFHLHLIFIPQCLSGDEHT